MPKAQKAQATPSSKTTGAAEQVCPLKHVAIIMDGNRRWADRHGLPRLFGHKEGVKALKRLVKHVTQLNLPYLTVYAFSSENWGRSRDEVDYLMQLFNEVLKTELDELARGGSRLRFIGDISGMPAELQAGLKDAERKTASNTGLNLQVALNYGSRLEIAEAVKKLLADCANGTVNADDVGPELIERYLYTAGMPDPDLLIRTGGEMRLSNYLLWQSAYAELYVTPVMWPEFTPAHFDQAVASYTARDRRYGGD